MVFEYRDWTSPLLCAAQAGRVPVYLAVNEGQTVWLANSSQFRLCLSRVLGTFLPGTETDLRVFLQGFPVGWP